MTDKAIHSLSVFATPPARGTEAAVVVTHHSLEPIEMQRLARELAAPATCFAVLSPQNRSAEISCYSTSGEIRCCGHGLLATAYVLHCRHREYAGADAQPWRLRQRGSNNTLRFRCEGTTAWLQLPSLASEPIAVPAWAAEALGYEPANAAVAGGENDYLVLEYAAGVPLEELRVQHAVISANTARAVIVTQRSQCRNQCRNQCKSYDFLLRYFAPQYGVNEDKVTGSACRILAEYWSARIGTGALRALQCSAEGGVVELAVERDGIWVGGDVQFL